VRDSRTGPPRILVVDDDSTTRETFRHMLAANGYVVLTAPTVFAGFDDASPDSPDAILLDYHLPIADGLESLRQLRNTKQCRDVPVAIITGDYFLDEDVAGELNHLDARIHFKPLWEEDIVRIVRELLDRCVLAEGPEQQERIAIDDGTSIPRWNNGSK
jgi:DNA-binding response OmpR family regulator